MPIVLIVTLAGAGPAWTEDPPVAPPKPPNVKLLEAGAEPRSALRYRIPKGQKERGSSSLRKRRVSPPGVSRSSTTLVLTFETQEATPAGAFRYGMVLDEIKVEPASVSPDSSAGKAMLAALATLKGATVSATISDRGHVTDRVFPPHAGTSPIAEGQFEHALEQTQNFGSPRLPEEPVGIGARWEVVEALTIDGAPVESSAVFTLTARAQDRLELDLVLKQTAQPHEVSPTEGQPPGTKVEVLSQLSQGTGNITLDLTHLVPTKRSTKVTHTRKARVTTPKQAGEVDVVDEHKWEISSVVLPAAPVK